MSKEITKADLADPRSTLRLATELQAYVKDNALTTNIKGKTYVNIEGWQYAGSQLGIIPVMLSCDLQQGAQGEVKYKAEVEIHDYKTDKVIGRGFAICSNREHSKKSFDEYAIASMAQTRATGKAFRLLIGWFMKAAGFEPTPSEDMETVKKGGISDTVRNTIADCKSESALMDYANNCTHLHKDVTFRKLVAERKTQIKQNHDNRTT